MPNKGQRRAINSENSTTQWTAYLIELRNVASMLGESDHVVAEGMGITPSYLSKLLSGTQVSYQKVRVLHALAREETRDGPAPAASLISEKALLALHDDAVLSTPHRNMKEYRRARTRQTVSSNVQRPRHLPVQGRAGDRQGHDSPSSPAERFLTRLLALDRDDPHSTIDVLHAGVDVLRPPEVARVMAYLGQKDRGDLASDFAKICGREQEEIRVMHTARDLLDPHHLPDMARKLLNAALTSHRDAETSDV